MRRLENKVAIVTGGARGIGEGIVRRFVEEGARVVIADVLEAEGRALAAELGDVTVFERLDVTSRAEWDRVIAATETHFGKVDSLVNNAGILIFKKLDDLSEDEMRRIIEVNLLGTMIGTQAIVPAIERAGGGTIINMSSADGISAANGLSPYCASKFGVRGFSQSVALELGPRGIRVNTIHPGGIYTPLANQAGVTREMFDQGFRIYPAQRAGDPADIGAAAAFLASDDARYCIGTELSVDGGLNAGHYYMAVPGAPKLD